jgi:hypothetical protein
MHKAQGTATRVSVARGARAVELEDKAAFPFRTLDIYSWNSYEELDFMVLCL